MEANCEEVLAAAEKVKRRTSKWDVPEEHHVETEIKFDNVVPAKVDDTFMDHKELDSPRPSLSMDIDVSDIDKSTIQSGKVSDNNIIQSDVNCEMPQNPEHFALEGACKDGFEKLDRDHVSKKHTMSEHVQNQYKQLKGTYEISPGPNERRQRTRSISPIDGRSKLDRKRNRSRSPPNDSRNKSWSRSRSPSHAYKPGSERRMDTERVRGMSFCRDFASGRCRRDDCRFLHEGNGGGLRQIDRQFDAGSTIGRGSRSDKVNYSREKLSRRHDDPYEDGRDNNESHRGNDNNESHRSYRVPNRCFDFTKGRCQRGASCKYAHHGASSDGGWNARDESRVRSHDSGSGNRPSFSQRQERHPVNMVPCKFFLENLCRHGESCKFLHQVKPADIPAASSVDSELHDQTTHFAPPLPFNGQMQQIMHSHPQNLHNQFPALLPTPNSHYFNTSLINQPSQPLHYELNLQNPDSQVQVQQNLLMQPQNKSIYHLSGRIQPNVPPIHILQNQSNFNTGVPIQQNVPPIHNAQNQPEFNFGVPIQQNVPPVYKAQNQTDFNLGVPIQQNVPQIHNVQNQPDFNARVPVQHNVPPSHNAQNQSDFNVGVPSQQNLAPDAGHSQQDASALSHVSDAKKLIEKNQTSAQQHMSLQVADSSETKPSQTNPDNPITNKVVTIEQAAKIVDLSASLAQFFGTAALNSQSTAGMTPQPFLNPDSLSAFATTAAPFPTEVDSSQANLSRLIPLEEKPHIQQIVSSNEKEAKKPEAPQINKDQIVQPPNDDEGNKKNGDDRKIKEDKEVRMFKCALIEFVKDMLKPKWKEGQLSKEAHKTIVKKVVDKVCGSLQGPNLPQTQEKIDLYLANSKPKLSKLVQAYVEKYVKS